MTRAATAAGVANGCHFGNRLQPPRLNLALDCTFRHKKTGTDQGFVTSPIVASRIAVLAYGVEQRCTSELDALCICGLNAKSLNQCARILSVRSSFSGGDAGHAFCQNRRGRNQNVATRCPEFRLCDMLPFVNLNREPHVRAAAQRRRPAGKTRLVCIANIARVEKVICGLAVHTCVLAHGLRRYTELRGEFQSATLFCL